MQPIHARFVGVELYFDHLENAKKFYLETLGSISPMSKAGTMQSSTVAQVLSAWSEKAPSPILRETRRFSPSKCLI
jgi:hypothetical protein